MILLTGVTGRIGGAAAKFLSKHDTAFRCLAREPAKLQQLSSSSVELMQADLLQPDTLTTALNGVSAVLLVTPNGQSQLEMEKNLAAAAAAAGVKHIVKISSAEALPGVTAPFPQIHLKSEDYIRSLDIRSTMLRPNFFTQNLLMYSQAIANADSFTLPLGDARTAMIDARDVGVIAARCLMDLNGKESASYELSGPELLDFDQVADRMSKVLGRQISYVRQSHADYRAFLGKVIPNPWHVNAVCELFENIADGSLETIVPGTEALKGAALCSLSQFVEDYSAAFGSNA
jgi:uncharacterized protein YbjT (DUF2867 family)